MSDFITIASAIVEGVEHTLVRNQSTRKLVILREGQSQVRVKGADEAAAIVAGWPSPNINRDANAAFTKALDAHQLPHPTESADSGNAVEAGEARSSESLPLAEQHSETPSPSQPSSSSDEQVQEIAGPVSMTAEAEMDGSQLLRALNKPFSPHWVDETAENVQIIHPSTSPVYYPPIKRPVSASERRRQARKQARRSRKMNRR